MKSFIVFAAVVAVALAGVPRRRQAHPLFLSAVPAFAHASGQPCAGCRVAPADAVVEEAAPSVPVLFAEPLPAASQEAPRIINPTVLVAETPLEGVDVGDYRFAYELSDGQKRAESAQIEARSNPEESILRVQGYYSFVGDDGKTYTVTYIADENGFQPQGAHLPVAPKV